MDFQGRYKQLNAAQRAAVDTIDGPVMVIAGPGTGKTELLSMRVANILRKTDTLPENILCLTYTDSGADAMRRRLISIIGPAAYRVAIHTFHSFGTEVISQNREFFYRGAVMSPADSIVTYEILRIIFAELPRRNPLAVQQNGEYSYQSDVQTVIGELKKAGLTSAELLAILDVDEVSVEQAERILQPILDATVSKKMLEPLASALEKLRAIPTEPGQFEVPSLLSVLVDSLSIALESADGSTKPITAWKSRWFEKNSQKQLVMKARAQQQKLRTVAELYDRYLAEMEKAERYDYDDMILQIVHALEIEDDLRYNLQEKYQYLLVDEFQDTNLAQMRILRGLTDNPVNEGRPNIFIVGDDDQAIYSFQGADLSNILNFQETYPTSQTIVLTENYRSTQGILDAARSVITQGSDRLETIDSTLDKTLNANSAGKLAPVLYELASTRHERHWIAKRIREQIDKGADPSEIAVLLHHHREIQALLPYLTEQGIAVNYERRDNILELDPIIAIEKLARIIVALANSRHDLANALLPELLAHPAWGFSSQDIWQLSSLAYDQRKRWLDVMEAVPAFVEWRIWLIELVADSSFTQLEVMLDRLMGTPGTPTNEEAGPLYNYYFSRAELDKDPGRYLTHLEALRILRAKLIEYHPNEYVTLASFVEFLDLHRHIGDRIQLTQQIGEANAVRVMTAHSAKGLEFDHVYVIGVTDNEWGQKARTRSRLISYPENLALAPQDTSYSERLRLFYVALTRARQSLSVSYSLRDNNERAALAASFLLTDNWTPTIVETPDTINQATGLAKTAWYQPFLLPTTDLQATLLPRLENYRLSATHLTSFLDLSYGGPESFLLKNLLHFPTAPNPHTSYGSAVHRTLQQLHTQFATDGKLPPIEDVLVSFETNLRTFRFEPIDFDAYLQKGTDELTVYLEARIADFSATQKPELDLSRQQSMLDDVRLGGIIDLADINTADKTITVTDYKTGHPASNWNGSTDSEKIKLHKYRQQLLFYKLLVEGARDYHNYTVTNGILDFIEPSRDGEVLSLDITFEKEEMEHFKKLVTAVWTRITTLDLPETSSYDLTLKGIVAFENDLIEGNI